MPLPSSKQLLTPVPGAPQLTSSFAETIALSPEGRYAAILNNGYTPKENGELQSIAVLDLATNQLREFPDARLGKRNRQTYFVGLAFSADGSRLYASVASITDPTGERPGSLGNGIAVYSFENGAVAPQNFLKIPLQPLRPGQRFARINARIPARMAIPYPAGLAVVAPSELLHTSEMLVVANNLSDGALLLDAAHGKVLNRLDLTTSSTDVPAAYPYSVVVLRGGRRAWIALWNASAIAEVALAPELVENAQALSRKIGKQVDFPAMTPTRLIAVAKPKPATASGSHPTAMLLSPDETRLYVALANADQVAVIDAIKGKVSGYLSTALPTQEHAGTYPNALAQSSDGKLLFVANASSNAVAVFDVSTFRAGKIPQKPMGFIPTDWYPTALAVRGDDLLVASGKAQGTGPNKTGEHGEHTYIANLLRGSIARLSISETLKDLPVLTQEVLESNLMLRDAEQFKFAAGRNPIKHVIYVLKENRTYDQVFGDLKWGDGDPSLTLFGEDVTPNHHNLARQFGILDNFYDSGEVSGDGHLWSTAAITTDYNEKTWQINYRNGERTYDYQGQVAGEIPLDQGIPDINEPATGYIWTNLARHKRTYRQYGEFIEQVFCNTPSDQVLSPKNRTLQAQSCPRRFVEQGAQLPANLGQPKGGPSPWPWRVPILAASTATKPELRGHFDEHYVGWNLDYPDQLRADQFLNEFEQFVRARKEGKGTELPQFTLLYLPNDHTSGASAGKPTPAAMVADNDLALGRVVDAVSHSPYWDDTAIFVIEDDAQNGGDHVDAHRSIALVISKYSPSAPDKPLVDHNFYTTVSMIHTMEALLGLPPMNNNDARAPLMTPLFTGAGQQPAYTADETNLKNGLVYKVNPPRTPAAAASARLDFSRPDAADTAVLNRILWRDRKGAVPPPKPRHSVPVHRVLGPVKGDD